MVLGIPFRVEVGKVDEDNVGETVGLYRKIVVSSELDKKRLWSVFVHEWVHAVMYVNGVANILPNEVEEILAQSFEHAIEELLLQVGNQLMLSLIHI